MAEWVINMEKELRRLVEGPEVIILFKSLIGTQNSTEIKPSYVYSGLKY